MEKTALYMQPATSLNPGLIIYLIDASHSMNDKYNGVTKMDLINNALRDVVRDMVRRSMRDGIVQRRYKIAVFAYSTAVIDVLNGIRDLPDVVKGGLPMITAGGETDTMAGFLAVEGLLRAHLAEFESCPAPLVCHLTDALITTNDPTPVVKRIQAMTVRDGPVLVENVYVAENMLRTPVQDWHQWGGVVRLHQLTNHYARMLFRLSSPIPEHYRQNINNYGYNLQPEAAFFFPGLHMELVHLGFAISIVTQLK